MMFEQLLGISNRGRGINPRLVDVRFQNDRHPGVDRRNRFDWLGCQNRATRDPLRFICRPEACEGERRVFGQMDVPRISTTVLRICCPFIKTIGRDQASLAFEGFTKHGFIVGFLGFGIECREVSEFFCPERNEAPPTFSQSHPVVSVSDEQDILRRADIVSGLRIACLISSQRQIVETMNLRPRQVKSISTAH